MSLTVGELAALISVCTLVITTLIERFIELVVRNYSVARLKRTKRAPVVQDSDTWLLNIPRSLFKFYRYPGISTTLVCAILLVAAELASELGVDVKKDCGPNPIVGPVISNRRIDNVSEAEIAASGLVLSRIKFVDKRDFQFVPRGFPRHVNAKTCISCFKLNTTNYILKNCSVKESIEYPAGEFSVRVANIKDSAFGTVATEFIRTSSGQSFAGDGDLTRNLEACALLVFNSRVISPAKQSSLTPAKLQARYYETVLGNEPCHTLIVAASNGSIVTTTENIVTSYDIECEAPLDLDHSWFKKCLRAYWAMQLENTIEGKPIVDGHFTKMTREDVYRAVLGAKIFDNSESGSQVYYEYFECGEYVVVYMAPFITVVLVICLLGLRSFISSRDGGDLSVPASAKTWFSALQIGKVKVSKKKRDSGRNRSCFSIRQAEFVLDGEQVEIEIDESEEVGTTDTAYKDLASNSRRRSTGGENLRSNPSQSI